MASSASIVESQRIYRNLGGADTTAAGYFRRTQNARLKVWFARKKLGCEPLLARAQASARGLVLLQLVRMEKASGRRENVPSPSAEHCSN